MIGSVVVAAAVDAESVVAASVTVVCSVAAGDGVSVTVGAAVVEGGGTSVGH